MSSTRLAALLVSKLCHDLIGPVGALLNGAELIADEKDAQMRDQAIALMADSASEVSRRLTFYRLAFGAGTGLGETVAIDAGREAAQGIFLKGRTRLDWPAGPIQAMAPKEELRLVLNLILVAATALPRGGDLAVQQKARPDEIWAIAATGPVVRLDPAQAQALSREIEDGALEGETLLAQLAFRSAREHGLRLQLTETADSVRLAVASRK